MSKNSEGHVDEAEKANQEYFSQPFLYEIRVKGRLSEEKWKAWFDNLYITTEEGETVLRGTVQDHAALYGLIGRLRDLAVPLLFVNMLDAEAWRKFQLGRRRSSLWLNLLLILVYLLLLGGLVSLTVFASSVLPVALALALLFAVLGAIANAIYLWDGGAYWPFLTYLFWPASIITFFIYLAVEDLAHPSVVIATLMFLFAGGCIYLVYYLRNCSESADRALSQWEALNPPEELAELNEINEKEKLLD